MVGDVSLLRHLLRTLAAAVATLVTLLGVGFGVLSVQTGLPPLALLMRTGILAAQTLEELRFPLDQDEDPRSTPLALAHGIASGDPGPTNAIVWARASRAAHVQVIYGPEGEPNEGTATAGAYEEHDFTVHIRLAGLRPDTRYVYQVWLEADGQHSPPVEGRFRTAPEPALSSPVFLVFSGDLGGSHYCRHEQRGYAIFQPMRDLQADLFLALGDMIYADNICPVNGPDGWRNVPGGFRDVDHSAVDWMDRAQLRNVYLRHWRYNRADPHFQAFLARTPIVATLDDHEVINDSGGEWAFWNPPNRDRAGYPNLVQEGRAAFFAFNPIPRVPEDPDRIYRSLRWGKELEVFVLDARSYRSRNDLPDGPEKTMLGAEQLQWLLDGLRTSDATWKLVVSSVTLSFPTGGLAEPIIGRDGWANGSADAAPERTGFERELLGLLTELDRCQVQNLVFITGDVHRAATVRYEVDLDGDGDPLRFHELVAGPLSAHRNRAEGVQLDPTLRPQLRYLEGDLFNFGYVRLEPHPDGTYHFLADVRGEDGHPRPGSSLDLAPTLSQNSC